MMAATMYAFAATSDICVFKWCGENCRIGMRVGYNMRQQAIAACYAKALRLNSSSIADISAGKVTLQPCIPLDAGS